MEIFIMAAISRGRINTLYGLQHQAGLQPGSINPVIRYLEQEGALARSAVAERGRRSRTMVLTEMGERFLRENWRDALDAQREMETILRSVTVALLMGEIGAALGFLHRCADIREPGREGIAPATGIGTEKPIDFLSSMRTVFVTRRRAMEAQVLREIAVQLEKAAVDLVAEAKQ
jgi:DNA-binding MarR family transcriptional regulator